MNYGPASAAGQNLQNIDYLKSLTENINAINLAGQQAALGARIPQATALETASSANIAQELQGKVPADVMNLLGQQAAERGVITGGATDASYLRALGLTSLGQEQAGQQNLSAALARNPAAPLFDPTGQMITPGQVSQQELQQQQLALEQERLNLEALGYGRGGGGTRTGTYAPDQIAAAADYSTGGPGMYSYGPLGTATITEPFGTADYFRSINWNPVGAYSPTGVSYGPMTGEEYDYLNP